MTVPAASITNVLSEKPLVLRPREASIALGIGARTLWAMSAPRGPIPCVRLGRGKKKTVLYPVAALKAWLESETEGGQHES